MSYSPSPNVGSVPLSNATRWRLDACLHHYGKLRDEIVQRIAIQDRLLYLGLWLTVVIAGSMAALYKVFYGSAANEQAPSLLTSTPFLTLVIPMLVIFGLLVIALLYSWVYQVWMMFRMIAYLAWLKRRVVPGLTSLLGADLLFGWDTCETGAEWRKRLERAPFMFGQIAPLLCIALLAIFSVVGFSCRAWTSGLVWPATVGFVGGGVLFVALCYVAWLNLRVHKLIKEELRQ